MFKGKYWSPAAGALLLFLNSGIVSAAAKAPADDRPSEKVESNYPIGIIGAVEPVFVKPFKAPFPARIDTGAAISSLDARDLKMFERDGKPWVSFTVVNPVTKDRHLFKKAVKRKVSITRTTEAENRLAVDLTIRIGELELTREFTLSNREKFEYPVLIGRNVLAGIAIVDVARENTLKKGL